MAAVTFSFCSCSMLNAAKNGDVSGLANGAVEGGQAAAALNGDLDKCNALANDTISYQEERSMGGAMAVAAALHLSSLRIDAVKATDTAALAHPETLRPDPEALHNQMTAEVAKLGAKLGTISSRPEIFWTFAVIDDPSVNAFSAPGGYVFVSRGLVQKVTTEDALAGALAHEISHITEKHAMKAYLASKVWGCRTALVAKYGSGPLQSAAAEVLHKLGLDSNQVAGLISKLISGSDHSLNFDDPNNHPLLKLFAGHLFDSLSAGYAQDQELEADQGALALMTAAGYAPQPFIELVGSLPNNSSGYLSHHPPSKERVTAMNTELKSLHDAKAHPFIDWKKINARQNVKLASAITRGIATSTAAGDAP